MRFPRWKYLRVTATSAGCIIRELNVCAYKDHDLSLALSLMLCVALVLEPLHAVALGLVRAVVRM